ncbi:hypothetical protein Aduo_005468 [Ancylostoma duodenale]
MSILYNYAADVPQQFYTEGPSLQTQHIQGNNTGAAPTCESNLRERFYTQAEPSASSVIQEKPRYVGREDVSKSGKRQVFVYRIPGAQQSYSFALARKGVRHDSYICIQCERAGAWKSIKVKGDEFQSYLCEMDHISEATDAANDIATRLGYATVQDLKSDPENAGKKPLREWMKLINSKKGVPGDDEELWDDIQHHLHDHGFSQRRKALSRLEETIQRACRNGLHTIVADGMFSLHPKELGRHAQLYCIHAVCAGGVEVPILFAITAKKTAKEYTKIFNHVKEQISKSGREDICPTRIILDFEKAAIKAAKKVFPNSKVEGCAFHLSQAWNRRMDELGLQTYINGDKADERIRSWWHTIKGMDHEGYTKCDDFLKYLRKNWLVGTYKDLWAKWEIEELRTTNLAEAFNRKVGVLFESDHPPLKELIDGLKNINTVTNCSLRYMEEHPEEGKRLRARDRRRREKISELMNNIEIRFDTQGLSAMSVETYCKEMSAYVTEKSK